jgi:hypothetical protein
MKLQSECQLRMLMKWVGLRRTGHVFWTAAMSFAETRRIALKYLTCNDTSRVRCSYLRVSLIHLTLNKLFIKLYFIGRKYNILSLFNGVINIVYHPQQCSYWINVYILFCTSRECHFCCLPFNVVHNTKAYRADFVCLYVL